MNDRSFLVEATCDEIKNVAGYNYYDNPVKLGTGELRVGMEIPVGVIYERLRTIARRRLDILDAAKVLSAAATLLATQMPIITAISTDEERGAEK